MRDTFDEGFWQEHWERAGDAAAQRLPPHPALGAEVSGLVPARALDAGCGEGAEAVWLASRGWQVTAVDISAEALARGADAAGAAGELVVWRQADLTQWEPDEPFDLVTTFYAHAAMDQLDLYRRLAGWVAPGGTLLLVGHSPAYTHAHAEALVTAERTAATLSREEWTIATAEERERVVPTPHGHPRRLHDVIVRAQRL